MSTSRPPEERLGRYRLLEPLGAGGMATVWRGEQVGDAGFRKKVAIKRILPRYRRDPALIERFVAEARTSARLDHPNLVHVLDFGVDPEPYLVLEFVEGVSLGALLARLAERRETLDVAAACFIGAEVALGLDHAHRMRDDAGTPLGIVHRDVSPQNVLLGREGSVKVSDFGLAKAADNVLKTQGGVTIGKLSYMAPEQAEGRPVDGRADVFALGVVLWEMLTVEPLMPANDPAASVAMLRAGGFARPSTKNPDVPPALDALVLSCLEVDREARAPSAQQVSQDLREILHARAAGYGPEQLARNLRWLFPERGWENADPDRPPPQPSADERSSLAPNTPALVAIARAEKGANPPVAAPAPAASPLRGRAGSFALGALAGVVASIFVALVLVVAGALWHLGRSSPEDVVILCEAPGARAFLGAIPLGHAPVALAPARLDGAPLVVLAPGFEPAIVRAELVREHAQRTERALRVTLTPALMPSRVVVVHGLDGGVARTERGALVGAVPGTVRVPTEPGQLPPSSLAIVFDDGRPAAHLALAGCAVDAVCEVSLP